MQPILLDDEFIPSTSQFFQQQAPIGYRLTALVIDLLTLFGSFVLSAIILSDAYLLSIACPVIVFLLLLAESTKRQGGIGKRIIRLKVVSLNQQRVAWYVLLFRGVLKIFLWCHPFTIVGTLLLTGIIKLARKDVPQYLLHDIFTKTRVVIYDKPTPEQPQ